METGDITSARKIEHINLSVTRNVDSKETTLFNYVRIVHNPMPEVDFDEVELETVFCGKRLGAPFMITAMTGGHPDTAAINRKLGIIAEKYGLAIGVGSQRAGIEKPETAYTFRVMREVAPNAFIVANLGLPQLADEYGLKEAVKAVEMINADALAIHLNVGQELYQYEGDRLFTALNRVIEIVESLDVPVIIKETGNGLSGEIVRLLYRIGVKCFDVAGLGGTSWIKVESLRARSDRYMTPGVLADYWGNPTALGIIEARHYAPGAFIVGSGGLRSGLDAAKAIALGADIAGMARPVLQVLIRGGLAKLERFIENILYNIKTIILMTGGRKPVDLWRAPITIWGRLREEAELRGINVTEYIMRDRITPLLVRKNA